MNRPSVTVVCRIKPTQHAHICVAAYKGKVGIISKAVEAAAIKNALKRGEEGVSTFQFDNIFTEEFQEEIYIKTIRGLTEGLFSGVNACVLAFGPSKAGKSYTLRGKAEDQRGLIMRTAGEILSSMQSKPSGYELRASAYAVHNETVHDLVKMDPITVQELQQGSVLQGLSEQQVSDVIELSAMLERAIKVRKVLSTDAHFKDKIHQVLSLQLYANGQLMAKADFIELAGCENASPDQKALKANKVTEEEKRSIAKAFNALTAILGRGEAVWSESKLMQCIKSTLASNRVNVWFIVCVSPEKLVYKHSLAALRYAAKLRDSKVDDRAHFEEQVIADLRQLRQDLSEPALDGFDNALNWIAVKETQLRRIQYSLSTIAAQGAVHINLNECTVEVDIMKKQIAKLKQATAVSTRSLEVTQKHRPEIMIDQAYSDRGATTERNKTEMVELELAKANRQILELTNKLDNVERASVKQIHTLQDGSLKYRELVNRLDHSNQQLSLASKREAELESQLHEMERRLTIERNEHRKQLQALQGALEREERMLIELQSGAVNTSERAERTTEHFRSKLKEKSEACTRLEQQHMSDLQTISELRIKLENETRRSKSEEDETSSTSTNLRTGTPKEQGLSSKR
mmetsp:Transcript_19823/g.36629  ORF Transcript_19823/g.36629 Transcript_19823/m.36629 type:complete len:632 (+) Transcript_19823:96-1991(+)